MTLRRGVAIAAAVPVTAALFVALVIFFIPDRELKGLLDRWLAVQGYTLRASRLGKAFPAGISGRDLHLSSSEGELLRADAAAVRLKLLPLFAGRVELDVVVRIGSGTVRGEIAPLRGGKMSVTARGVRLEDIPYFVTAAGAKVQGELAATGAFRGEGNGLSGELKVEVKGVEVSGVKLGEMPVPDAAYRTVQGAVRASAGRLVIDSLTLDGDGVYARLKGDFPLVSPLTAAPLNLTFELMPKPEFLDRQKVIFLLLMRYQTSPGHYELPIRGTLGRPAAF